MTARGAIGGIARPVDEHELLDPPQRRDNGSIEIGTVGWYDRDQHFDLGTEDNDGHTLVLVTLFRGRDLTEPLTPDVGQGQQIVARMGKPARAVPSKGETVLVARPAGHDGPGAWHIIGNPGPGTTFRNGPKPGDVLFEGNAGNFVRFGQDGAVSFATTLDGTSQSPTVQFQMRRDGFLMLGPWGKLTYDAAGFHILHHTGARLDLGGIGGMPSPLDSLGSYANLTAAITKVASSIVSLGPDAGVHDNVPLYTPLLAILGEIATALSTLQASVVAVEAVAASCVSTPATAAAITAAGTAIGASSAACSAASSGIGAAPAVLPSQAVTVV